MESADTAKDPEILMYFSRHYSRLGLADTAIEIARGEVFASEEGFVCAPYTLLSDSWLEAVQGASRAFFIAPGIGKY